VSERRALRLAALALVIVGGAASAIQFTGTFDFGEGSLWLPVSAVAGIIALIRSRPRTNRKKDTHA
jgi:uncharacterized membrane protein YoaK (UPF0700 family)